MGASAQRPDDWKPHYYLGLILWTKGRTEEARRLFAQCEGVDFAPFFLSRAMLNLARRLRRCPGRL